MKRASNEDERYLFSLVLHLPATLRYTKPRDPNFTAVLYVQNYLSQKINKIS